MRRLSALAFATIIAFAGSLAVSCQTPANAPHQRGTETQAPDAALVQRADALLARMTLEEKVGQLNLQFVIGSSEAVERQIRAGEVGGVLFVSDPAVANRLQRIAVDETRLGIPLIAGFDVVHGFETIFPVPIAQAASFDPEMTRRAQSVAASEARAAGVHWVFAPMLDVARDPRWGRMVEGSGEDPYLASQIAKAQVEGFQSDHIGAADHVIAGPKHFAGYGAAPGGRDYESVQISDSDFYNVYLRPFAAAVDAGAGNIMAAYTDLNDVPAVANAWLLNDVLREQLGFSGWVVSDANAVGNQVIQHYAVDNAEAARRAIQAGTDMAMALGSNHVASVAASVREGKLSESVVDRAVRRILIAKLKLGLFEQPYVDETRARTVLKDPSHRDVAQQAAERSMALLKNDRQLLPLSDQVYKNVAVIGPLADSQIDTLGPWAQRSDPAETVTLFAGVKQRLGPHINVQTAPGVQLLRAFPSPFAMFNGGPPVPWTDDQTRTEFEKAIDIVRTSDVVILALGETSEMSGERASRGDLALPGDQQRLFDEVTKTGKPVVVVLLNGRPLDIRSIVDRAPAILEAWHPGTRGGVAIARTLFGDVNPGGKLPITWPRSVGQVPIFYAHNRSHGPNDQATRYLDEPSSPLYPFGYGLSYTTFEIAAPQPDKPVLDPGGSIVVSTTVTNTGSRSGDQVVQLYLHQRNGTASRPVRELKGFQRVSLLPGESRSISFQIDGASVKYWNAAERAWVIDAAVFDVWVGSDSTADKGASFSVSTSWRSTEGSLKHSHFGPVCCS